MENEFVAQFLSLGALMILFVLVVAFLILSFVLNYHWTRYGISAQKIEKVRLWYFTVSFVLLGLMALSLIFILL